LAYDGAEEELKAIQQKIEREGLDWTPGLNPIVTEYSPEERQKLSGLRLPDNWEEIWQAHLPDQPMALSAADLPASFNWEDSGKVTPVTNQGGCGSCWIFASVAALEAIYKIQAQVEYDLSEQQILSCVSYGWGCDGGWMDDCYQHFRDYGSILESAMPYEADDMVPCTESQHPVVATIDGWTAIPNNITSLKTAVMTAPVAVAFTVYNDFHYYNGGCYSHPDETQDINHAVLIVGWDDNMCNGEGAWRVKNSWGTYWGEDGYFWMKYGSCNFGVGAALLDIDAVMITSPAFLPDADMVCDSTEYEYQFEASGGTPPYNWYRQVGFIPDGMVLETGGLLHGFPTRAKNFTFGVRVEDSSVPVKKYMKYVMVSVIEGMAGDADCNCDYNLLDATYLINLLYKDGPTVMCEAGEDANGDASCNLLDVTCLINYLYKEGPQPGQ
jgi:hypothetical protein